MATALTRIGTKARDEPKLVFSSIYHHVYDIDNLRAAYDSLKRNKAVGIDGVDKDVYARNLEVNLINLSRKLKNMAFKPLASRRTHIPKPGSKKERPLGIGSFEGKIVEKSIKNVLEQIYEEDFEDNSYGYRPMRSPHDCLGLLGRTIQKKKVNYVVEADIRSFFDRVNHAWLMKFLAHRIGDKRILRIIERFLKAGILENGLVKASEEGTPQGSILSPLLSNVYLHYVLDLWFNKQVVNKHCRGEAYIFRYADDFVACFQYKIDACNFEWRLRKRLEDFNLEVAEEKTQTLEFGRFARRMAKGRGEKPKGFTFLGFDHYCGKTKEGHFKVKRRTNLRKLQAGLRKFTEWCEKVRRWMIKGEMLRSARRRIVGHLNYYAITDNSPRCGEYIYHATRTLFKWLNRKSQRNSYTWSGYQQVLLKLNWPMSGVRKDLCPCRRKERMQAF